MPRLNLETLRCTHDLRDARAIGDLLNRARIDSTASGSQLETIEALALAMRRAGAVNLTLTVSGEAPNALSPLHQHAAHDAARGAL